ncbi:acyl carrier protein [Streptomyces sp. NPDC001858]
MTQAPAGPPGTAQDEILRGVVEALEEVLGAPGGVDAQDDFFELGGNSLLAAQTVALLRRRFAVKVTVRELFDSRTAGRLATLIGPRVTAQVS